MLELENCRRFTDARAVITVYEARTDQMGSVVAEGICLHEKALTSMPVGASQLNPKAKNRVPLLNDIEGRLGRGL